MVQRVLSILPLAIFTAMALFSIRTLRRKTANFRDDHNKPDFGKLEFWSDARDIVKVIDIDEIQ